MNQLRSAFAPEYFKPKRRVFKRYPVFRRHPWMTCVCLALLAPSAQADSSDRSGAPALKSESRETAIARWALSYAPIDAPSRARVLKFVSKGTPKYTSELLAMGEPARRILMDLAATNEILAERTSVLRAQMQELQNEVERRDAYCDLRYLSGLGEVAAKRVARIVPPEAPRKGAVAWCMERAGSLRWEPTLDRYALVPSWGNDQAPRRWQNRDTVNLQDTKGMIAPKSAFTAEFWVRWPAASNQSLLSDEAWPDMGPNVSVSQACGFTFRRNHHGNGVATLDFTYASERSWWTVESAPLHVSTQWEHIAVASDGEVIRIFRDGSLVAARAIPDIEFIQGERDMSLGVVPEGHPNRRANFDLRAFRVSEGARYTSEFVPPHRFRKDASTILSLDFTPGTSVLDDLSQNGHVATGEGHWIAPHDLKALAVDLNSFGSNGGDVVLAEAELGGRTGPWYAAARSQFSEGVNLEIFSDNDPGANGYAATVPFRVPHAGMWRIHFVGGGLHRGSAGVSPFSWHVDDAPVQPVLGPLPSLCGVLGRNDLDLAPLGVLELAEGDHVFHLKLLSRRRRPDTRWAMWMDALVLQEVKTPASAKKASTK